MYKYKLTRISTILIILILGYAGYTQHLQVKEKEEQIKVKNEQIKILQELDQASTLYRKCVQQNNSDCGLENATLYHKWLRAHELKALPEGQ